MCNDLNDAIELQKDLDIPEGQKAMMLIRACKQSIDKLNKKFVAHVADANSRLEQISDEQKEIRHLVVAQNEKIETMTKAIQESNADAARYRLLVEICKAMFGNIKRTVTTFIIVGVLLGLVHFKDVLDIVKALIV